jgi:hypothetical protein
MKECMYKYIEKNRGEEENNKYKNRYKASRPKTKRRKQLGVTVLPKCKWRLRCYLSPDAYQVKFLLE